MAEYMNKLWYIHTINYYRVMKINELWLHATWKNLTNNVEKKKPNSKKCILYESIYTKFKTGDSGHSFGKGW